MQTSFRDTSVSMAKGMAIILMVLVHASFSYYGALFITMFHMPLFFFMSGYCFKEAYLNDFRNYLKKRIKGAYWPYVKWGLLFLALHNLFFLLNIYNDEFGYRGVVSELYTANDFAKRAFLIIVTMNRGEQLLGGYWFLHSYLFASIISFATIWLCRKKLKRTLVGGGVLLVISVLIAYYNLKIPYIIGAREVFASVFIISGFVYKREHLCFEERTLPTILIGGIIVALGVVYWPCSMLSLEWQKIIPYYISALFGTIMIFAICKLINSREGFLKRVLTYIGDRTLDILTWHLLSFKIVSILIISIYGLSIKHLAEFPVIEDYSIKGWWIVYLVVGVTVSLLIGNLLTHEKKYNNFVSPK